MIVNANSMTTIHNDATITNASSTKILLHFCNSLIFLF